MRRRLSISDATAWAQSFLRAELRLTLPVALALMGLPAIALELLVPPPQTPADMGRTLLFALPAAIPVFAGWLTITALALVPGISVAEALKLAGRRLVTLIGAMLLAGLGIGLLTIGLAMVLALVGIFAAVSRGNLTAMMMAGSGLIWLFASARLCLLAAVLADRPVDPVTALRRSWALTAGHAGRLAALLLIVLATSLLLSIAVQSVSGVLAWALGQAIGITGLMEAVVAIAGALLSATVNMLLAVLLAAIYRQLEGAGPSRGI